MSQCSLVGRGTHGGHCLSVPCLSARPFVHPHVRSSTCRDNICMCVQPSVHSVQTPIHRPSPIHPSIIHSSTRPSSVRPSIHHPPTCHPSFIQRPIRSPILHLSIRPFFRPSKHLFVYQCRHSFTCFLYLCISLSIMASFIHSPTLVPPRHSFILPSAHHELTLDWIASYVPGPRETLPLVHPSPPTCPSFGLSTHLCPCLSVRLPILQSTLSQFPPHRTHGWGGTLSPLRGAGGRPASETWGRNRAGETKWQSQPGRVLQSQAGEGALFSGDSGTGSKS